MNNYFSEKFQYDSCIARGICSISPKNSALQTVIVLYLRIIAKYLIKLCEKKDIENDLKIFILNSLVSTVYNTEISERTFDFLLKNFRQKIPKVMDDYAEYYPEQDLEDERKKLFELFDETQEMISAIKYGERMFNRSQELIESSIRDLYSILIIISKSLSIKILELKDYDNDFQEGFLAVLKVLVNINLKGKDSKFLVELANESAKIDIKASKLLRSLQEEKYGTQTVADVSYTTYPNKAVLVVGSNIKELEDVLVALKDFEIDIYSHDDMMLAYTFPKFLEYKNLKGQFGQGVENCLLDFATFPGPIILTKHSLHNIENFYRGRLFTTDYTSPKGIVRIENDDYSKLVESAKEARGFKTGKECETITVGFDFDDTIQRIFSEIETGKYKRIFVIGLDVYSLEQKAYFEKIVNHAPDDVLVISFSYKTEHRNIIYVNACYDMYSIIKIYDCIIDFNLPVNIFIPKCNRESISQMLYFNASKKTQVYLGKCIPIMLNPSLLKILKQLFGINFITSAKKDLESILKN